MGFHINGLSEQTLAVRMRRVTRVVAAIGLLTGIASVTMPSRADAQVRQQAPVTHLDDLQPDGTIKQIPISPKSGFDLFAAEDLAFGTLRMTGQFRAGVVNQGGPNAQNQNDQTRGHYNVSPTQGGFFQYFQMGFAGAAPPSEFRKIRAINPGINNMTGSLGYTTLLWETLVSSNRRWGAADAQFGKSFSGVTSDASSSCRADGGGTYQNTGFSLLAQKDCPDTWGSEGFRGKLTVPDSVWLNTFNGDKSGFRWDDWRLSRSRLNAADYLGTQSVYGFMSDYYREQRLRWGSVIPGGSGSPLDNGYPLGLELRMDSYQFSAPSTRNTQFYQVQMVNKSASVYGTGIDYDSLYFGLTPGILMGGIGGQYASLYFDFSSNTIYMAKANTSGNCSTSFPKRYLNTTLGGCQSGDAFGAGVYTMTWLKSPLGDVRNKRFSRDPADVYYNPSSLLAGDTITFNHSHPGSVGRSSQALTRSTRAGFGYLASKEDDFMDGRNPSDFTLNNFTGMVTPEQWDGTFPTSVAGVKFSKFVPGSTTNPVNGRPFGKWDYNHDGVQDTIAVPGCGSLGCAGLYSDSIAGGWRNEYGNIFGTVSAGPFKLKANDTTQFLFAFSWSPDSVGARKAVEGLTEAYRTNYAGPQPIAYPQVKAGLSYTIESAELLDSITVGAATTIGSRLTVRYPQISPVDPFMIGLVNKVRADSLAGDVTTRRLLRLNPGLLDSLRARANDNLALVYVFKSCDGGVTFTNTTGNSATCTSAPTRAIDAAQPAFSWRPVATVLYVGGVPQTPNYSEALQAGRTYNYSFVTRTRGFSDANFRIVDSVAGRGLVITNVQDALGFPLDTINSAFATSGPASLSIYAPITNAAGRQFARVDTATLIGKSTQPVLLQSVSNDVTGSSRLVFANQFIIRKTVDTVTRATNTTVSARYVLPNAATSATGAPQANFLAREQVFTAAQNIPVRLGINLLPGTARGFSGSARVFVDTINATAAYPGYVWVTADNRPIFAINDPFGTNGGNQVRDQAGSPLYPGFNAQPDDSANTANGFRQERLSDNALRDRNFVIRKDGDTLSGAARVFVPQVQGTFTTATTGALVGNKRVKGGRYELTWQTDPWGSKAPFNLDPVASLQATITASLLDVASKTTTFTETSAAVVALVGAPATRPLVRVRVPFTMKFTDPDGGREEQVKFAMQARQTIGQGGVGNTRLLGSGNDTVRVSVPDSLWMPGDTLIVLQKVERDSSVGTGAAKFVVVQPDGSNGFRPIPVLVDSIGLNKFLVACTGGNNGTGVRQANDANSCNPLVILSRGASTAGGYLAVQPAWRQLFELTRTFDARSALQLTATPYSVKSTLTKADLGKVSVVPNPYLVRSDLDLIDGTRLGVPRIYFTNVPEQGVLRVYSVSGQFIQELTWTKSDLTYAGNNSTSGDLPFNLRTREGTDMASGLYLYVLTATGSAGKDKVQSGKFVIIR